MIFKNNPENIEVKVLEFNIIGCVPIEKGFEGLVAVDRRNCIDTKLTVRRFSEVGVV